MGKKRGGMLDSGRNKVLRKVYSRLLDGIEITNGYDFFILTK